MTTIETAGSYSLSSVIFSWKW